jgi:hypothetical protein
MLANGMTKVVVLCGATTGLLFTGAALAQTDTYTWAGKGVSPAGSSRCPTYYMVINVAIQGNSVKGRFQQEIRQERHFEATKDASGAFKAKVDIGGGNSMDVTGSLKDGDSKVMLIGYCMFGGPLTKK